MADREGLRRTRPAAVAPLETTKERFERLKAEACRASVRSLLASIPAVAPSRAASPVCAAWRQPDYSPKRARLEPAPAHSALTAPPPADETVAEAAAVHRLPPPVDEPAFKESAPPPVAEPAFRESAAPPVAEPPPPEAAPAPAPRPPPFTFVTALLLDDARAACPLHVGSDEATAWLALATAPQAPLSHSELLARFASVCQPRPSSNLHDRLSAAISHGAPILVRLRSSSSHTPGWLYGARLPSRRAGTATLGAPSGTPSSLVCPDSIAFREGTLRRAVWNALAGCGSAGMPLSAIAGSARQRGFSCTDSEVGVLLESSRVDEGVFVLVPAPTHSEAIYRLAATLPGAAAPPPRVDALQDGAGALAQALPSPPQTWQQRAVASVAASEAAAATRNALSSTRSGCRTPLSGASSDAPQQGRRGSTPSPPRLPPLTACARALPYLRGAVKAHATPAPAPAAAAPAAPAPSGRRGERASESAALPRNKPFRVSRSASHGLGLFARRRLAEGERVVQYVGQLIGNEECERREAAYRKAGVDNYLFRLHETRVIDATFAGNEARFINHSCAPNCRSKAEAGPDGRPLRIWIVTTGVVQAGTELAYDYFFDFAQTEDGAADERVPCSCGAATCRGFMN